jgi:hypothetical protein
VAVDGSMNYKVSSENGLVHIQAFNGFSVDCHAYSPDDAKELAFAIVRQARDGRVSLKTPTGQHITASYKEAVKLSNQIIVAVREVRS